MDLNIYTKQKAAGFENLVKVGPATVAILSPQFSPTTGEELPAALEQINLKQIDDTIAAKESELAAIKTLRDDIAAVLAK